MFGHLHMFGHIPIYFDVPIWLNAPICLAVPPHMSECPTHICMPPCSPKNLYVSREYLHMIWGWVASIHPILSAHKLLQG